VPTQATQSPATHAPVLLTLLRMMSRKVMTSRPVAGSYVAAWRSPMRAPCISRGSVQVFPSSSEKATMAFVRLFCARASSAS
jgi:hypothetical protein